MHFAGRVFEVQLKKQLFVLILFVFLLPASARSQEYFSPKNILKFADYLYEQEDYLRAAAEYQRYLTTVSPKDSVLYTLGLSYEKAKKFSAAEAAFSQIGVHFPGSTLFSRAMLQTGFLWVLQNDTLKIRSFQVERLLSVQPLTTRQALQTVFGVPFLVNGRFGEARAYFRQLNRPDFSKKELPFVQAFEKLAVSGQKIGRKEPVLAGALSALLPGLGRLYTGRVGDGLYSMFFIGISGYSAYRGFARSGVRSGRGWILGSLTTALYLGNVYGSYLSAKIVNQKREHDFRTQVVLQLDWWHAAHHLGEFIR